MLNKEASNNLKNLNLKYDLTNDEIKETIVDNQNLQDKIVSEINNSNELNEIISSKSNIIKSKDENIFNLDHKLKILQIR